MQSDSRTAQENMKNLLSNLNQFTFTIPDKSKEYKLQTKSAKAFYNTTIKNNSEEMLLTVLHQLFQGQKTTLIRSQDKNFNQKRKIEEILKLQIMNLWKDQQIKLTQQLNEQKRIESFGTKINFEIKDSSQALLTMQFQGKRNIDNIYLKDVKCLIDKNWLNDILINFFSCLMMTDQYKQVVKKQRYKLLKNYYIFNTFFCTNLQKINQVKKQINIKGKRQPKNLKQCTEEIMKDLRYIWLKNRVDLTKFQYIFFPIHQNVHWNLILIVNYRNFFEEILKEIKKLPEISKKEIFQKLKEKINIYALDSMDYNDSTFENIENLIYILNELTIHILRYTHKIKINRSSLIIGSHNVNKQFINVPQQENSHDCGPSVLENMEQCIISGNQQFKRICQQEQEITIKYPKQILTWKRQKYLEMILGLTNKSAQLEFLLEKYFAQKKQFLEDFEYKQFQFYNQL